MFGRKLLPGLAIMALFVLAGSASAYVHNNFLGTVDDQWSNPANWSEGVLPISVDGVGIDNGISAEVAGIDAVAGPMYIIHGASLTVSSGSFTVAFSQSLDIYEATLTVTGGNVIVGETVHDILWLGTWGTSGVINVSGGKITITTLFLPHTGGSSVGVVNLSGGEMEITQRLYIDENGTDGTIDITDSGVLRINTDVYHAKDFLQTQIGLGNIITSDPLGTLLITEISLYEATVTMVPEPATMALLALGGLFTLRRKK